MHGTVFNDGSTATTKAVRPEAMVVEMEERKREYKWERERERQWTHSCGFPARLCDNFDPILFKRANTSTKSENRGNSEKWENYRLHMVKRNGRDQVVEILWKCKRKKERKGRERRAWNGGKKEKWETRGELWRERYYKLKRTGSIYVYTYYRGPTYQQSL